MAMERNALGQLLPGSGGRHHGAKDKAPRSGKKNLQAAFMSALEDAWNDNGEQIIRIMIAEFPEVFFKTVASLMPKELLLAPASPLSEHSDEDLGKFIAFARASLTHKETEQ